MQTFYCRPLAHKAARNHQIELEKRTQVKWDFYDTNGGTAFTAVITRETPQDEALAIRLLPYLTPNYLTFVRLSELSGLTLPETLIAAKTLAQTQRALANVNRNSNFAAIRSFPDLSTRS